MRSLRKEDSKVHLEKDNHAANPEAVWISTANQSLAMFELYRQFNREKVT